MIAEAIGKIQELVSAARNVRCYKSVNVGEVIIDAVGNAMPVVQQFHMNSVVNDLESLARAVKAYSVEGSTVWINDQWIVAILEDIDVWDGYRFPGYDGSAIVIPAKTPHRTALRICMNELFHEGQWPTRCYQKEFYNHLSYDFAGAVFDIDLKPLVRKMKWATHDETDRELKQGADAMGRSVRSEVSGTSEFPEYVHVNIVAFETPDSAIEVRIKAQFIVDTENRSLGLVPLPGELARAKREALTALRLDVVRILGAGSDDFVYLGTPGV